MIISTILVIRLLMRKCNPFVSRGEYKSLFNWGSKLVIPIIKRKLKWKSLLLLLLSHLSHVRLCATPQTAAQQAPPSLGFSRQEHWSGLPFLLQCVKVKSENEVAQLCPTLSDPMDCSLPGCPWDFPGKSTGVGCQKSLSQFQLFATPWTIQAMEFSRPKYRSG